MFTSPVITVGDHVLGLASAPVSVIEYGDYECPFCRGAARDVHQLLDRYSDMIRFAFRNFPVPQLHPHAEQAAEAAEAAPAQGKFWAMYELLLRPSSSLDLNSLVGYAERIDLDTGRFKVDPLGVAHQRVKVQAGRGPQQELVHCPEFPLRRGCLRRFGGLLRVRMQLRNGEVPEGEPDHVRVTVEQPVHVSCGTPAIRALVVAVLGDAHGRARRAKYMVVRRDYR